MVGMRMRQDQAADRFFAQVLLGKCHRCCRRFARGERVDHDPTALALDQGNVGDIKAAQLVDPVHHLEEADVGVELGVAPQAGVDGVRRGSV